MNETKTVICDIDDVLANLKEPMCKLLNEHAKTQIHWNTWDSFFITHLYDITDDEFYNLLIDSDILSKLEPYPNAVETIAKVKDAGYKVVLISSRNYHPDAYKVTETWLNKHNIVYDKLHISGNGIKKSLYANMYDNIKLAIDDNVENCKDFMTNCKINKTVLMNQPWNISEQGIPRINSIEQVMDVI